MFVFLGVALILFGLCLLVSPKSYHKLTESWKSTAYHEPSQFYMIVIRIGGALLCVLGILSALAQFL